MRPKMFPQIFLLQEGGGAAEEAVEGLQGGGEQHCLRLQGGAVGSREVLPQLGKGEEQLGAGGAGQATET